ncbi:MAG: hypothetical protein MUE85_20865 [Microscillaceae bacterium]|jgi:hypothetical protein|nr:hypothetical protein [Microscillaceae bacterium]
MKRLIFTLLFIISLGTNVWAQKRDRGEPVEASIEVLMEGNYSKVEIREKAIQAAKIQAMGEKFGYSIIQGINTQTKSTTGSQVMTMTNISEVSNTMVKGEWISDDTGYPKTRFVVRDKGEEQEIWLLCEVRGRARKVEQAQVAFESFPYNCQEPHKCNNGQFRHQDSMFLYFKTPVSGYLSVFMLEEGLVYRLLPYAQMRETYESVVPILADKEYLLFDPTHRDYFAGFGIVDEYGLETNAAGEPLANLLYIIFSTKPFNKPALTEKDGLKTIELNQFQEWLNKNRALDKNFQVSQFSITVNK